MPSVISGDANVSATEFGFLDGVTSGLQSQIDSKLNLAGGKILQIVRATDTTARSTTSTTATDVTGMSVTITPTRSSSWILVLASFFCDVTRSNAGDMRGLFLLSNSANTPLSGAELVASGVRDVSVSSATPLVSNAVSLLGYNAPATTSATTYKLRFYVPGAGTTVSVVNNVTTGQMYAIEVSA